LIATGATADDGFAAFCQIIGLMRLADLAENDGDGLRAFVFQKFSEDLFVHIIKLIPHRATGGTADFRVIEMGEQLVRLMLANRHPKNGRLFRPGDAAVVFAHDIYSPPENERYSVILAQNSATFIRKWHFDIAWLGRRRLSA